MDAITNWATGSSQPGASEREYRFSVGKKYEGKGGRFFYRTLDSIGQYGGDEQFQFSVAQLPDGLDELVREAQSVDKGLALVLVGKASVSSFTTASGKSGRRATFTKVSAVQPQSPVLDRRIASRLRYVREGWHRPITKDRKRQR